MPLQKGDVIGGYEIIAPLGQGGMATVYKAYHARLQRYVAIKMIHQAYLDDENYLTRFEREAQIIAGLEHPHIVPVYDFSEHQGEPYLVMKLIEGNTLKAILAGGELPMNEVLGIADPIASALDYAHSRGVLHRDVKPSNIILDKQNWAYLSDFGLARLTLSGGSTLSQDLMIGTPYYMSPEQATANGELDHRSDLYSFGVVLYEQLAGRVPFSEGTPYSIINDHVLRELPLPSSLNPNIPPAVELVLLKALSKDPDERYQSAAELVGALRMASANGAGEKTNILKQPALDAPPVIPATTPAEPTRKSQKTAPVSQPSAKQPSKRLGLLEAFMLAIVVVLVVILVAFAISRSNAPPTAPKPTAAAQVSTVIVMLPPQPTEVPATQRPQLAAPTQRPAPPTVPPFEIPSMTAQQARDMIARDPHNLGAYLALAKAQLQNGEDAAAKTTLTAGALQSPDRIRFEMTAALMAEQIGRYDFAFAIYSQALEDAQGQLLFPVVRETAGAFLYTAATMVNQLTLAQITALETELATNNSSIVSAMIGQAYLSANRPRLARTSIDRALGIDSNLAEAHLVNGNYQQAQGDHAKARAEWRLALNAPDAPQWVRDLANQLINSSN